MAFAQALLLVTIDMIGYLNEDPPQPLTFLNLIMPLGSALWNGTGMSAIISKALGTAVTEAVAGDALPLGIGFVIQALLAANLAGGISATSCDIATSS